MYVEACYADILTLTFGFHLQYLLTWRRLFQKVVKHPVGSYFIWSFKSTYISLSTWMHRRNSWSHSFQEVDFPAAPTPGVRQRKQTWFCTHTLALLLSLPVSFSFLFMRFTFYLCCITMVLCTVWYMFLSSFYFFSTYNANLLSLSAPEVMVCRAVPLIRDSSQTCRICTNVSTLIDNVA